MKTTRSLCIGLLFAITSSAQTSVLHLNLGSHSETNDPVNYLTALGHNQMRALVKQLADSVIAKQIKWNMQVDANFIRGTLINDTAYTNSGDILQWADNSAYIEVDPHNHFNSSTNPYNFADIAHLLDSCGLPSPRKNAGGFLWDSIYWNDINDHWTLWQNGLQGYTYTNYTWPLKVIWGGGSPNHVNDDKTFGIWKPAGATSQTQFQTHDTSRNLTCIGGGCGTWVIFDTTSNPQWIVNSVINYLNYFAAQPVTSTTYYTATIMTNFKHYTSSNYINKIMTVINGLAPYGPNGTGQIVWETLTEKYTGWYTQHTNPSDNSLLPCTGLNVGLSEIMMNGSPFYVFPNPAGNYLSVGIENGNATGIITITDISGKEIRKLKSSDALSNINIADLPEGIYLCRFEGEGRNFTKRFIVAR